MPPEQIQAAVRPLRRIQDLLRSRAREKRELGGSRFGEFVIDIDGSVGDSTLPPITVPDAEVGRCIVGSVPQMHFAKSRRRLRYRRSSDHALAR